VENLRKRLAAFLTRMTANEPASFVRHGPYGFVARNIGERVRQIAAQTELPMAAHRVYLAASRRRSYDHC
jgi:hypothetical protein